MFTKENCASTIINYDNLKIELERILQFFDSFSRSITNIEYTGDTFAVSYEDYCRGCYGYNSASISFELLGKSDSEIQSYVAEKNAKEAIARQEQYEKTTRENDLAKLKELSAKYPDQI